MCEIFVCDLHYMHVYVRYFRWISKLKCLWYVIAVAQKVVALRKKQQLSIGPCKSLPNSPSHSSVPAASIPSVHINQVSLGHLFWSGVSLSPEPASMQTARWISEKRIGWMLFGRLVVIGYFAFIKIVTIIFYLKTTVITKEIK